LIRAKAVIKNLTNGDPTEDHRIEATAVEVGVGGISKTPNLGGYFGVATEFPLGKCLLLIGEKSVSKVKPLIGVAIVAIFGYLLLKNILPNIPTDVSSKFAFMEADMSYMLKNGGHVVLKNDLNRNSAAFVMRDISADSWSDDLFKKYRSALYERGWSSINVVGDAWQACRSGVLATISTKRGFFPARGIFTYSMRFEYNGGTVRRCKESGLAETK
jgi:hypothetical protein